MLEFVEEIEVGRRLEADINRVDLWDIKRLDRSADEE
jgi:hypothetical protein